MCTYVFLCSDEGYVNSIIMRINREGARQLHRPSMRGVDGCVMIYVDEWREGGGGHERLRTVELQALPSQAYSVRFQSGLLPILQVQQVLLPTMLVPLLDAKLYD